jgi:crotonobetainyl-CoA:carnitine CoA-transferase CaiB-like acyl-CoA transferase
VPATGVGVLIGFALMGRIDESRFAPLIGTIVLVLTVMQVGRMARPDLFAETPHSRAFAWTMGLLAGVTTMMANAAGPIFVLYALSVSLPKFELVGTGAIEPHFYANLCKHLGCEQWLGHQTDDAAQDAIRADFAAAFRTRDRDTWVAELAPADTCVAPVYAIDELAADPQFVARGIFAEAEHPTAGRFRQVAPPLAGLLRGAAPVRVPDTSVTDTDALLAEAGVARATIEKMRESGVVA